MVRCGCAAHCAQARPRCRFAFPASPRPTSTTCTSVGSSAGACARCSSHSGHSFRRNRPAGSGQRWSESPACSPRSANWMAWPRCRPCKVGKAAASWLRPASLPSSDLSAGWQVRQIGRRSSCVPADQRSRPSGRPRPSEPLRDRARILSARAFSARCGRGSGRGASPPGHPDRTGCRCRRG